MTEDEAKRWVWDHLDQFFWLDSDKTHQVTPVGINSYLGYGGGTVVSIVMMYDYRITTLSQNYGVYPQVALSWSGLPTTFRLLGTITDNWDRHFVHIHDPQRDLEIPNQWKASPKSPDKCLVCGSPGLVLFNMFDCTNSLCQNHQKKGPKK